MGQGVLVTRPLPQADATAERLIECGYQPVLAPLLRIEAINPSPPMDLSHLQAILVTSALGARFLATALEERALPVLAVGARSAAALKEAGFSDVRSAHGDAAALSDLVVNSLNPSDGVVLHARGRDVANSPLPALMRRGFRVREVVLYEANQICTLPDDAREAMLGGDVKAALVYSPRTAEALAVALSGVSVDHLALIGISEAALAPLSQLSFADRRSASEPTEDSMFEELQKALPPIPTA